MSVTQDNMQRQAAVVAAEGEPEFVAVQLVDSLESLRSDGSVTQLADASAIRQSDQVTVQSKVFSLIQATLSSELMSAITGISCEVLCSAADACGLKLLQDISTNVYVVIGSTLESFRQLECVLVSLQTSLLANQFANKCVQDTGEGQVSMSSATAGVVLASVPQMSGFISPHSDLTAPSDADELNTEPHDNISSQQSKADGIASDLQISVEKESNGTASDGIQRTRSGRQVKMRINNEFLSPVSGVPQSPTSSQDKLTMKSRQTRRHNPTTSASIDLPDNNEATESESVNQHQDVAQGPSVKDNDPVSSLYSGRTRLESREYEQLKPYQYFCTQCSFRSKRAGQLQKHVALHARGITVLKCPQCSYRTTRSNHLTNHRLREHGNSALSCTVAGCNYVASTPGRLTEHASSRHTGHAETELIPCPVPGCGYRALTEARLLRHKSRHRPVDGSEASNSVLVGHYRCSECSYETTQRERFQRHVDSVHSNIRLYMCDVCGKQFKRPNALQQHYLVHCDSVSASHYRAHTCSVCQRTFRSKSHLSDHEAIHSSSRSFACSDCGATFKTRAVQRKHLLTIHSQPGAHVCTGCRRTFNTRYAMQRHARLHQLTTNSVDLTASQHGAIYPPQSHIPTSSSC